MLNNLVRQVLDVFLHSFVIELSKNYDLCKKLPSDESLGGKHGILWVGDGLSLGRDADQLLSVSSEGHNRGCSPKSFLVLNHLRHVSFHHCDARVCGTKVDADDVTRSTEAGRETT